MRRVLALLTVPVAILAVTACSGDPASPVPPASPPGPSGSSSAAPSPTVQAVASPGDVAATKQVCADATAAAADVTKVFNDNLAAIEVAAAKGDQAAMVEAAEVIQQKFVGLSGSLAKLSQRPVDSDVKVALTTAAAALREISSESYPGTTLDTQQRLADLATVFAKACA